MIEVCCILKYLLTSITKLLLESDGIDALVVADCAESVLTQDADEPVDRILPDPPFLSRSPVLRCFFSFRPWKEKISTVETICQGLKKKVKHKNRRSFKNLLKYLNKNYFILEIKCFVSSRDVN